MKLLTNKKAIGMNAVILIVLALAGFLIIGPLQANIVKKGESMYYEELCRSTLAQANEMAIAGSQPIFQHKCITRSVDLPLKKGNNDKQDIKKDIADLISKCWYSHLEGQISDDLLGWGWWKNNCDVCYQFTITDLEDGKKDIDSFPLVEELEFLIDEVKQVNAESDGCNLGGGFCTGHSKIGSKEECEELEGFTYAEDFGTCRKKYGDANAGCCYSTYNCLNNGGDCIDIEEECGEGQAHFSKWTCPRGKKCCVDKGNYYNYLDYVQKSKGPGKIIFDNSIDEFVEDKQVYTISFVANTDSLNSVFSASAAVGAATAMIFVPGVGWTAAAVYAAGATGTTVGTGGLINEMVGDDINYILVSPYQALEGQCNIQN